MDFLVAARQGRNRESPANIGASLRPPRRQLREDAQADVAVDGRDVSQHVSCGVRPVGANCDQPKFKLWLKINSQIA